jgi:hypothetical protein
MEFICFSKGIMPEQAQLHEHYLSSCAIDPFYRLTTPPKFGVLIDDVIMKELLGYA